MAKRMFRIAGAGAALLAVLGARPVMAQALPDPPPADRQPVGLSAPRIAPLPESQWTDEHRRLVERYTGDGRADNQLRTLLNVPAIVEGLMPFTVYLTEASTLTPRHRSAVDPPGRLAGAATSQSGRRTRRGRVTAG